MLVEKNPALNDKEFLLKLDNYIIREQMAKIVVLNFDELPIGEITGNIVSGNITIQGKSACRRTCNLTMTTEQFNVNDLDWQLHSKYYLYVGLKNFVDDKYEDIIWFPQGMFILTNISTTNNLQGLTVSIQGKDKMCLIDGTVGGALFASHDFGTIDVKEKDGRIHREFLDIKTIVREAIHMYAHEPYENIIINDVDDVSVELVDYKINNYKCYIYDHSTSPHFATFSTGITFGIKKTVGSSTVYEGQTLARVFNGDTSTQYPPFPEIVTDDMENHIISDSNDHPAKWVNDEYYRIQKVLSYGDTAGYRRTPLTYPGGELIINVGGTVTQALDKIVQVLGEFEYFYDTSGCFHFQRKKIYHNIYWNGVHQEDQSVGYFNSSDSTRSIYDFNNGNIIESYANKPKILNIRNDWSIWGKIGNIDNNNYPCHLRYAIDDKPLGYHCLTDDIWYHTDGYTLGQDELSQDYIDYQNRCEQYRKYISTVITDENEQKRYIQNNVTDRINKKTVDWREILYRMALDYQNAQARVKELEFIRKNYNRPIFKYSAVQDENNIYDNNDNNLVGYYDIDKKQLVPLGKSQLADVNEQRVKNELPEWTWEQYIRSLNKTFFYIGDIPIKHKIANESSLTEDYTNWVNEQRLLGVFFVDYLNHIPYFNFDDELIDNMYISEIQAWESRMSSRYSIYFTDMLDFWTLNYKTENDLTYSDVSEDDKKILNGQLTTKVAYSSFNITNAQSAFEQNLKILNQLAGMTEEDKLSLSTQYYNDYKDKLYKMEQDLNNPDKVEMYPQNSDALSTWRQTLSNYFDAQITNLDNSVPFEQIKSTYDQYIWMVNNYKLVNGEPVKYGEYQVDSDGNYILDAFGNKIKEPRKGQYIVNSDGSLSQQLEAEQLGGKVSLINQTYQKWVANDYWNPNIVKVLKDNQGVSTGVIQFIMPERLLFWIDFLATDRVDSNASSDLAKYKVSVIGHRSKAINDDKISAIFFRTTPSVLFVSPDEDTPDEQNISYIKLNLSGDLANYFTISSQGKSAKEELDNMLYESTYYQESITISCLPIYYLDVNTRIRVVDEKSGISGEYIVQQINMPLAYNASMSITANKAADRLL